jgi:hypothetical protein
LFKVVFCTEGFFPFSYPPAAAFFAAVRLVLFFTLHRLSIACIFTISKVGLISIFFKVFLFASTPTLSCLAWGIKQSWASFRLGASVKGFRWFSFRFGGAGGCPRLRESLGVSPEETSFSF